MVYGFCPEPADFLKMDLSAVSFGTIYYQFWRDQDVNLEWVSPTVQSLIRLHRYAD
jgi:hypothetical protein